MRPLLVLRPEPGASVTARRAEALGLHPVIAPLFAVRPLSWTPPEPSAFDAVMLTSANALRHGGPSLALYRGLPAYAVGEATAAAAREAGFGAVIAGDANADALAARIAQGPHRRVLHLCGEPHRATTAHAVPVYTSVAADALPPRLPDALREGAVAMLHSPRAACLFATLLKRAAIPRAIVAFVAISEAAAAAAGGLGWRAVRTAHEPTDAAMLAIALVLCENDAP